MRCQAATGWYLIVSRGVDALSSLVVREAMLTARKLFCPL